MANVKKEKEVKIKNKLYVKAKGLKVGKEKEIWFVSHEENAKEGFVNSMLKKIFVKNYGYTEEDFHGKIT